MAGEAVHERIKAHAAERAVSYQDAFNAVVHGEDVDAKAYQNGVPSAGDLLARLMQGLDRLDGMDSPTVDRLANEGERLREILTSLRDRDADLLGKTERAVAGLIEAIAAEERHRREQAPHMTVELGGLEYVTEEPPSDRLEAGRRLDELASSYQAERGTTYAEAFDTVAAEHPALRRAYGSLIPAFQRQVRCFTLEDPLADALRHMRSEDYSQIVVRDAGSCQCSPMRELGDGLRHQ